VLNTLEEVLAWLDARDRDSKGETLPIRLSPTPTTCRMRD
jgi:hypothetical protein